MDPKHREIAESVYNTASFALAETGLDTALFVLIKDNESIPILVPPGTDIDTAGYAMMSMHYAKEHDADAIVVVSGMWIVKQHIQEYDPDMRPSEHPDREHYLNLIYMTADGGEMESIVGKVETDPGGRKFVRDHEWTQGIEMTHWLEPWRE